ncbi:hypothetical protein [uncultured Vagococcus sp.]|uniref:hypothetical protein n=1 Tax=uncultured Vagococcus sp. TaxID=189676 RepID=UPI0028D5FEC6|nr:hypothetical protein [uncultured Vagococcus sp.]
MTTTILWSGITGRTGRLALQVANNSFETRIVAGICRSDDHYYNYTQLEDISESFDIIVDFSHQENLETILHYAIKQNKPLIIGTAGLSDAQRLLIEQSSLIIPIFLGGNFQFKVKRFIDEVLNYAKNSSEPLRLVETHYKTKNIPSETAKVIKARVENETNQTLDIQSFLKFDEIINQWQVADLICRVNGFKQLAVDVLTISSMMIDKPADGLYDLDKLASQVTL